MSIKTMMGFIIIILIILTFLLYFISSSKDEIVQKIDGVNVEYIDTYDNVKIYRIKTIGNEYHYFTSCDCERGLIK